MLSFYYLPRSAATAELLRKLMQDYCDQRQDDDCGEHYPHNDHRDAAQASQVQPVRASCGALQLLPLRLG
jgi:hypothetical protein